VEDLIEELQLVALLTALAVGLEWSVFAAWAMNKGTAFWMPEWAEPLDENSSVTPARIEPRRAARAEIDCASAQPEGRGSREGRPSQRWTALPLVQTDLSGPGLLWVK
jgi:hypothetical protein